MARSATLRSCLQYKIAAAIYSAARISKSRAVLFRGHALAVQPCVTVAELVQQDLIGHPVQETLPIKTEVVT
ncbi:MAG: hypothetical protein KKI16_06710 [Alphaproteobacteria bacterium]|nr:hypothetical protein [Alphaproteobacteria bacterium]